jgi:general secretion pathway protein G
MTTKLKHNSGFTLIELVVVVGIISVLSGIAIPAFNKMGDKAKIAEATSDLKNLQLALEILAIDTEMWPGPSAVGEIVNGGGNEVWDLNAPEAGLVATDGSFPDWDGPYVPAVQKDPWGNDYFFDSDYDIDGTKYAVLGSFGPNGVGPNVYDDDDIIIILSAS